LFVTLTVAQLALALVLRPAGAWRAHRGAPWVPVAVAGSALLLVAGVYLPGLSTLLHTEPIGPAEFALAATGGVVPAVLLLLARFAGRPR
jgi:Ca2+-transporting ATPase